MAFQPETLAAAAVRTIAPYLPGKPIEELECEYGVSNRTGLAQLQAGFDALGVKHIPSAGNFVLIDCGRPAAAVYEAMLRQGVIVRPVGNYQLPNHLRITIGTLGQNERMLGALKQALRP